MSQDNASFCSPSIRLQYIHNRCQLQTCKKRTPNYTVRGSVVNIVKCRVYKAFLFNLQCSRYNEATGLTIYDSRDLRHAFVVKDERCSKSHLS